jgi:hypothetical protein
MDKSKAIRAAKLTLGGMLEKKRQKTAVSRADGQIAPSKYLPNVPRQVHAAGGAANAPMFQDIHELLKNESGAPLDLYHGTRQPEEFEAFDDARLGRRDPGFYGRGHYLTPDKDTADEYAYSDMTDGTTIGPLHAALKNPYIWDVSDDMKSQSTLRDLQSMGIMREKNELRSWDNLLSHHVKPFMAEMRKRGHDGVVVKTLHESLPNGIAEVVAFDPKTIKHTEAEAFDPTDPRIRREDGGVAKKAAGGPAMGYVPMATLQTPRLAVAPAMPQQQGYQGNSALFSKSLLSLADTVEDFKKKPDEAEPAATTTEHRPTATNGMSEAALAAYGRLTDAYGRPLNVISSFRDKERNAAVGGADNSQHTHGNAYDIDVSDKSHEERLALADEAWNAGFRGIGFYDNSMHFDVGDPRSWGPSHSRDSIPDWARDWTSNRYGYASGGKIPNARHGMYSKALEVARNIQQTRGTPEQFMAQLRKTPGVKPAELEAIGMPEGEKITRDDFVNHIIKNVPRINVIQHGENPSYLNTEERRFMRDNWMKSLPPEEDEKRTLLYERQMGHPEVKEDDDGETVPTIYHEYATKGGDNYRERLIRLGGKGKYQSEHWDDSNILAHIRMQDRNAPNGDKLLHVEEIQSDWGQQGRKKGFQSPNFVPGGPYDDGSSIKTASDNLFSVKSRLADQGLSYEDQISHPDHIDAAEKLFDAQTNMRKPPAAPYVQNTQHWTDLAMKNILREAALGDYDGVIFTPGQVHADRYQQEDPSAMQGYYDNIVPKSAMNLVKQHDPSITPQKMNVNDEFDAHHIPLTSTAKESILKNGFPMFNRGGAVDAHGDGKESVMNRNSYQFGGIENGNAPSGIEARPQAGELQNTGGIRGGAGVLQTQNEAPLEGLPQKVGIPLSGQTITAGPDPRIRQVARDYMASTGMQYNPPTKYAKADPQRAKRIADAYHAMKDDPNDPLTKASYGAMIKETMAQYEAAKKAGLKVEFWNPEKDQDPYGASPRLATEDVRKNHHMWVFPTYAGYGSGDPISDEDVKKNPLLQLTGETWNGIPVTVNDVFRAIHDYYGHAKEGVGFRADGEENAWRAHASMFSPLARMAMTSETRGQNSWLNYGPHGEKNRTARTEDTVFAPQKIGVLPHWVHHEGAEDFTLPEDVEAMHRIRSNFDPMVSKAISITRKFTGGGVSAINTLKAKGK